MGQCTKLPIQGSHYYIEDAVMCVIIHKTWMVSCLRCPVATVFLLYVVRHQHVRHVTEEYGCARPVKTLYYDVQSSKVTGAHAM